MLHTFGAGPQNCAIHNIVKEKIEGDHMSFSIPNIARPHPSARNRFVGNATILQPLEYPRAPH